MMVFSVITKFLSNRIVQTVIAIVLIVFLGRQLMVQRQEIKRQSENYEILATYSNKKLKLNTKEFQIKIDNDETIKRALRDSLKIKAKQVKDLVKSSGITRIQVKTVLRDSLVMKYDTLTNQLIDTVFIKKFDWADKWSNIQGRIIDDSISLTVQTNDTLVIVNHWYKKGKWFLPKLFSKRRTRTEIVNSNPNATYTITDRIEIMD